MVRKILHYLRFYSAVRTHDPSTIPVFLKRENLVTSDSGSLMRLTRNIFSLLVAGSVSIFISLDVLANSPNDVNLSLENIQVNIDNGNLNRTIERLEAALSRERDPIEKG